MLRISVIAILLLTLLYLGNNIGAALKGGGLDMQPEAPGVKEKKSETRPDKLTFNPGAPPVMPDLNKGYVFQEDRLLEPDEMEGFVENAEAGAGEEAAGDIEDVIYAGSIIYSTVRKAIIAYQEESEAAAPIRRMRGGSPANRPARRSSGNEYVYRHVLQGSMFRGYKIAEVSPERIVFEKDAQEIVKYLYDQNKERVILKNAAPSVPSSAPTPVRETEKEPPPTVGKPAPPVPPRSRTPAVVTRKQSREETPQRRPRRSERRLQKLLEQMKQNPAMNIPPGSQAPPEETEPNTTQ